MQFAAGLHNASCFEAVLCRLADRRWKADMLTACASKVAIGQANVSIVSLIGGQQLDLPAWTDKQCASITAGSNQQPAAACAAPRF